MKKLNNKRRRNEMKNKNIICCSRVTGGYNAFVAVMTSISISKLVFDMIK